MTMFAIEQSPLGRVVVATRDPLFYTTRDLHGRLDEDTVAKIRGFVRDRFGIDTTLNTCTQVHGATVQAASRDGAWRECDSCDALWSGEKGVALGIKVADCLPVTIVSDSLIANVHSGWRGAVQKITVRTLDAIAAAGAFDPATARAYLGPTIRACCFEVGEEVVAEFQKTFGAIDSRVDRSRGKPHIDVAGLTADLLRNRGFAEGNVVDSGLCTRCDGSIFHSYRRDGKGGGRNLAIVAQ
ncbi:MAG TPA: polyphenol oxidase family protein [Thermoanaerobaculia bacterium]|nr:polyphenol oxidase family protein [Thermoanaerobaculia bacterium]